MPFSNLSLSAGRRLRDLLASEETLYVPGCYDALSANLVERAGYGAGAIGGFAVEAALMGGPDLGLISLTELADHSRKIAASVDIPLIADVDTGFGGVHNISRTIRLLEQADIAGVHIEDQVNPKRCPVLPGRRLVSLEEAAERYAVAVESRRSSDFYIIARTDGDSVSYHDQVERANAYLAAGADAVLPMMMAFDGRPAVDVSGDEQMQYWQQMVIDVDGPLMMVTDPPPGYKRSDVAALGVKIISMSAMTVEAAANAMHDVLEDFRATGSTDTYYGRNPRTFSAGRELMEVVHLDHYLDFEERHTVPGKDLAGGRTR